MRWFLQTKGQILRASILFAWFATPLFAQNRMVDSLKNWLIEHPKQDSLRVLNLHRLSYRLSEIDLTAAWKYANEAQALAKKLNNKVSLCQSFINYGINEANDGNYAKSQEHYLAALQLAEEAKWKRGKAICLNNIAENYYHLNQSDKALDYTFKALVFNQIEEQKRGQAVNYEMLGRIYFKEKDYDKSLAYFQQGLDVGLQAPDNYQIVPQSMIGIGKNYVVRKDFKQAFVFFNQATLLSEQHNEKLVQIESYKQTAITYRLRKEYQKALVYFDKALATAQPFRSPVERSSLYQEIAETYQALGNYQKALSSYKTFKELSDSLANKKNEVRAEVIELKYEAFRKDKENHRLTQIKEAQEAEIRQKAWWIGLLAGALVLLFFGTGYWVYRVRLREIEQVQKAQAETIRQMGLSEKMRAQIARDLHDDLGATLSSISMLSQAANRQISDNNTTIKELLTTISQNAQRTVETIRDIIWTTKPMNDSIESITNKMKVFATEILDSERIDYQFNIADELQGYKLPSNQQYNFYLIFKEALNNVAKYAKAQHVWIDIFKKDQKLYLHITDDGVGFDLKTSKGKGNGLANMEKRVEELKGLLSIQTGVNQGTTIELALPMG